MGMTFEQAMDKLLEFKTRTFKDDNVSELSQALSIAFLTMQNYQLLKISYNDRLKADMVAMLEDIKKEMNPIKECEYQIYGKEHWNFAGKCQDVIQQKIDALGGNDGL